MNGSPPVVLALGAHPDDIEFGCAPALLLERRAGHAVHLLVLSRGEAASAGTPATREREAGQAAACLGATLEFLDCGGDCHLAASPAHAIAVAGILRRLRPSIVLAPHPGGNQHPDHAAAGRIGRDACRLARYGGLAELRAVPPHVVANLYFYEITRHGRRPPHVVLDIGGVVADWERLMRCHASQTSSRPYLDLQLGAARQLGLSAGCEYALGLWSNDPLRLERLSALPGSARAF